MSWNHRIIERYEAGEAYQSIYEVYYNKEGMPTCWTEAPASVVCYEDNTWEEVLQWLKAAAEKPVLVEVVKDGGMALVEKDS